MRGLCSLLLLLWGCTLPAWGAVTFDAAGESNTGPSTATTLGYPVTVGSGSNRAVLVGLCTVNGTANEVTAATIDGDPLTLVVRVNTTATSLNLYLFRRVAPTVGTVTVSFTLSTARRAASGAIVLQGVDQTTPVDLPAQTAVNDTTTPSISVPVTTEAGDMLVDIGCKQNTTETLVMTAQSNRTERTNDATTGATASTNVIAGMSTRTGSGSLPMNWTGGGTVPNRGYGVIATNVNAAVGPAGGLSLGFKLLR